MNSLEITYKILKLLGPNVRLSSDATAELNKLLAEFQKQGLVVDVPRNNDYDKGYADGYREGYLDLV